jgi:hypothetical protein
MLIKIGCLPSGKLTFFRQFHEANRQYATPEMTDLPDMGKGLNPEASSSSVSHSTRSYVR